MPPHKTSPRAEFRQQENLRIDAAPSLAESYTELKSLTVNLDYFKAGGVRKTAEIKYTVNLEKAKAVFSFACPNSECVGGDFDLSEQLADAIASRLSSTTGEMCCQGWQSRTTIHSTHCHRVLRYKLNLEY